MGHRVFGELTPFGKPETQRPLHRAAGFPDNGCQYGGPSCVRCELPECVHDLSAVKFREFAQSWQVAQNQR
jgi:hypothetical protein